MAFQAGRESVRMTDDELRLGCLQAAAASVERGSSASHVFACAELYAEFVLGKISAAEAERQRQDAMRRLSF